MAIYIFGAGKHALQPIDCINIVLIDLSVVFCGVQTVLYCTKKQTDDSLKWFKDMLYKGFNRVLNDVWSFILDREK